MPPPSDLTPGELRAAFDHAADLTVGIEEEVMLLDPDSHDLAPRAPEVIKRLDGDPAFKLELPASQLEILTPARTNVPAAMADLAAGRARLAASASGLVRPAAAGAHPFAAREGRLNTGERYRLMAEEYGDVARRQLVCALQVHVAIAGADRVLAVYNALRGHLPEIAAVAAAAPFHGGRDTGLASVRPTVSRMLPRQGVPPAIPSWEWLSEELRWGAATGSVPEPRRWWWELRPNVAYGTLEVRVPDAQATLTDAAAVAAFVHALVAGLAERHDQGEALPVPESWRIEENRWSACRHGVEGTLGDLHSGRRVQTRDRLSALLEEVRPVAERLGCASELSHAHRLVEDNGAMRQRRVAQAEGLVGVARWLADRFSEPLGVHEPVTPAGSVGAMETGREAP